METTNLLAVITFAMVTAFTPGPNNLMLAASGANFGFRRTVPHIAGITIGFMTVFLAASAGLASLFAALPQLYDLLKILSVLFLIILPGALAVLVGPGGATVTDHWASRRQPCFRRSILRACR